MPESLRFCLNIDTRDDDFYSGKTACQPFTRSDAICTEENIRTQFNGITAFIDASNVYGSDTETADKLRAKTNGKMVIHTIGPLIPNRQMSGFKSSHGENPDDLVAGDVRAIEQPGLASMHSLFINEHNRIAHLLNENKPEMNDEEIYQVARKLVGGQIQNIVYNEFLPVVLGNKTMEKYKLNLPEDKEEDTVYDPDVDPTIDNEFATVAYRFGHSLIPNLLLPSIDPIRTSLISCPLKHNFFQFEEFVIGSDASGKAWQNLLLGLTKQQSPSMDTTISKNILDFLFCKDNCQIPGGFGQDLAARNIQRGRDHGLASYVKFRQFCNLTVPTDWANRPNDILEDNWKNLEYAYEKVEDIDPFTGGLSEDAVQDGLVGPTFACIIGLQFEKVKSGDRFFFTNSAKGIQSEQGLPKKVKVAIRSRSLGDILCDNAGAIGTPTFVMKISESEEKACSARDGLNFEDIEGMLLAGIHNVIGYMFCRCVTTYSSMRRLRRKKGLEF
jgi:peroxidase